MEHRRVRILPRPNRWSFRSIVAGHAVFVALIAAIVGLGLALAPHLSGWLVEPIGTTRSGKPTATGFQLLQVVSLVVVLISEWAWLSLASPKPDRTQSTIRRGRGPGE